MGCLDKDSVGATIVGRDGNSFIQEPVEVFDANCFVVATGCDVNVDIQDRADGLKEPFESTAVVDNE
jgi:hypothetical protein